MLLEVFYSDPFLPYRRSAEIFVTPHDASPTIARLRHAEHHVNISYNVSDEMLDGTLVRLPRIRVEVRNL